MRRNSFLIIILSVCALLSSCSYGHVKEGTDADTALNREYADSVSFLRIHHYTQNYNFVINTDSVLLRKRVPYIIEEQTLADTVVVKKGEDIVVVDIHRHDSNDEDSVWVQVAHDQYTFGWISEAGLLDSAVPNDPISQIINSLSSSPLPIVLFLIAAIGIVLTFFVFGVSKAKTLLSCDIPSFYPTLLTLIAATMGTFYASIQMFAPQMWQHFYFHPTLNPFSLPPVLSVFLCSVWIMVIAGIAAIDDVCRKLPLVKATLYLFGLFCVCAFLYMLLDIATRCYIGYVILIAYFAFALWHYFRHCVCTYKCGNCNADMREKGRCPVCGYINE